MKNRESFLINEYVSFSIIAGLATRNSKSPIYSKSVSEQERNELKKAIREYLIKLYENVRDKEVSDMEQLCNYWIELTNLISQKYGHFLNNDKFRIGISQKIINLFLKYLYCNSIISNFCFCPIDGVVKKEIQKSKSIKLANWTEIDKIELLNEYIDVLNKITVQKKLSIIDWEIEIWNENTLKNE